ncbi:hypothetical protein BC834DRAFT_634773 [Gloeopeniophorella convolvens]|nr:hypothetical protein BC834DRAFT_634773 [Gloeopeniophorella convolvens]
MPQLIDHMIASWRVSIRVSRRVFQDSSKTVAPGREHDERDVEPLGSDPHHWQTNVYAPTDADAAPLWAVFGSVEINGTLRILLACNLEYGTQVRHREQPSGQEGLSKSTPSKMTAVVKSLIVERHQWGCQMTCSRMVLLQGCSIRLLCIHECYCMSPHHPASIR